MRPTLLALAVVLLVLPPAVRAEVAVQAYGLPKDGGAPHDVAVGADGIVWYTAQARGPARAARSDERQGRADPARRGRGPARRDRRAGRRSMGHGGRHERDRPRRCEDPRGEALASARSARRREPQHADLRQARPASGSPARTASTAGSTPGPARCRSGMRRAAGARTASRRRRTAPCTTPRSPAATSARVDLDTGVATVIEPPTKDQGARRVWSDGQGRIWVSEWNSGNVSPLRSCHGRLEDMEAPGRSAARLRRLCGRQGHGLALRLGGERDGPLSTRRRRSSRPFRAIAAARTCGRFFGRPRRGVGAGVRRRPPRRLSHEVTWSVSR